VGGGAKSEVWNQIKADVLNLPYIQLNKKEFAVFGSAILAGYALGVYSDLKEAARTVIKETFHTHPNSNNVAIYQKYIRDYERLIGRIKPVCSSLLNDTGCE